MEFSWRVLGIDLRLGSTNGKRRVEARRPKQIRFS